MHDNTYKSLQDAGIALVLLSIVAGITTCSVVEKNNQRNIAIERARHPVCPCSAEAPAK